MFMNMEDHRILEIPDTAYYIPNFITEKREDYLLTKVYQAPKPKWTCLSKRRLQNWGGLPHALGMLQKEKLPPWLADCGNLINEQRISDGFSPNHVLVNEYLPGQGIMPHQDGPVYFPTVATISLGCHTVLDIYDRPLIREANSSRRLVFSFLLERRSLLVLKNSMYMEYLHGIAETDADEVTCNSIKNSHLLGDQELKGKLSSDESLTIPRKDTRVSLTIRYVPKTFSVRR